MKFKQIVILDDINISSEAVESLQSYSDNTLRIFNSDPASLAETKERLKGADALLVSWRGLINQEIIEACPDLKFICISGTNAKDIDLVGCAQRGITVSNVRDYGDEGVVEFIILELLSLVRGVGSYQWQDYRSELNGKTIGIIGLGVVGKLLAQAALGLKMKVLYNSLSRQAEWEEKGLVFVEKEELFKQSDFISIHTPKDVIAIDKAGFALMDGKVLINTAIGKAFIEADFKEWIKGPHNFAIMDGSSSSDFYQEFHALERVIFSNFISGRTKESILRLSQKSLDNVIAYTQGEPINKIN